MTQSVFILLVSANYVDGGDGNDVIGNGEAFLSDWGKKDRDVLNYAFSIPSFAALPARCSAAMAMIP